MSKTAQKLSQADEAVLKHVDPKMREEVARKRRDSRNGVYLASMARKKKNLPNLSVENKAFFTDKFHVAQKESLRLQIIHKNAAERYRRFCKKQGDKIRSANEAKKKKTKTKKRKYTRKAKTKENEKAQTQIDEPDLRSYSTLRGEKG